MSDPSSNPPSPVGSPPLILAFLAIGIFSAAMIAVFGWRRVQFGREFGQQGIGGGRMTRSSGFDSTGSAREGGGCSRLGEKPIMWEVWTDRGTKVDTVDYGCWDNVMPLAVLSRPQETPIRVRTSQLITPHTTPSVPLTSSTTTQHPRRSPPFAPASLFPLHIRTGNSPGNSSPSINTNDNRTHEEESGAKGKIAQIAFVVEMPSLASSRRRHHYSPHQSFQHRRSYSQYSAFSRSETLVETHDRMREDLLGIDYEGGELQYCIGVHNCPWPVSLGSKETKLDTTATRISQLSDKKVLT